MKIIEIGYYDEVPIYYTGIVQRANVHKEWYKNGVLHREDGPAMELINEDKHWYINGERHREDGPAIEYGNGTKEWYINNKSYTKEEYDIEMNRPNALRLI